MVAITSTYYFCYQTIDDPHLLHTSNQAALTYLWSNVTDRSISYHQVHHVTRYHPLSYAGQYRLWYGVCIVPDYHIITVGHT